jgi:hypothetical protein
MSRDAAIADREAAPGGRKLPGQAGRGSAAQPVLVAVIEVAELIGNLDCAPTAVRHTAKTEASHPHKSLIHASVCM